MIRTIKVYDKRGLINSLIGLLGFKKIKPIYFETRFGIHTFFLQFPIDVLILDSNNCIKKIGLNIKPFRVFFYNIKHKKIVELPSGYIKKAGLKINQRLSFKFLR